MMIIFCWMEFPFMPRSAGWDSDTFLLSPGIEHNRARIEHRRKWQFSQLKKLFSLPGHLDLRGLTVESRQTSMSLSTWPLSLVIVQINSLPSGVKSRLEQTVSFQNTSNHGSATCSSMPFCRHFNHHWGDDLKPPALHLYRSNTQKAQGRVCWYTLIRNAF